MATRNAAHDLRYKYQIVNQETAKYQEVSNHISKLKSMCSSLKISLIIFRIFTPDIPFKLCLKCFDKEDLNINKDVRNSAS